MGAELSRRAVLGLGGAGALAVAAGGLPAPAAAEEEGQSEPEGMRAGTIGLVAGQVARLVAVDHDHGNVAGSFVPCGLEIRRIDGKLLASRIVKLAPGTGAFVDFAFQPGGAAGAASRVEVYGLLRHPVGGGHLHGGSVQVFSASTGESAGIITPCGFEDPAMGQVPGGPHPGGGVRAGTIGLVPGQVARLVAVDHDHGNVAGTWVPCGLEIRAIDGTVLASRTVTLAAGTGAFVDFAYQGGAATGAGAARRLEVYGLLRHPPGGGGLHGGSLQVFSASTGHIAAGWTPCGFVDPNFG